MVRLWWDFWEDDLLLEEDCLFCDRKNVETSLPKKCILNSVQVQQLMHIPLTRVVTVNKDNDFIMRASG